MLFMNFITPPAAQVKSKVEAAQDPAAPHSITKLFGGFSTAWLVMAQVDGQLTDVMHGSGHWILLIGPPPLGPAVGMMAMIGGNVITGTGFTGFAGFAGCAAGAAGWAGNACNNLRSASAEDIPKRAQMETRDLIIVSVGGLNDLGLEVVAMTRG